MDILDRIKAYDCSDGKHSDAAQGTAHELMDDAAAEIVTLRSALKNLVRECLASDFNEHWDSFKVAEAASEVT